MSKKQIQLKGKKAASLKSKAPKNITKNKGNAKKRMPKKAVESSEFSFADKDLVSLPAIDM